MNWNIKTNYEERKKIYSVIQEMNNNMNKELDSIPNNLSDIEYDSEYERIEKKYNTDSLIERMYALEYHETKNNWFISFVESFGICKDRRISEKQRDIFVRYSELSHYIKSRNSKVFISRTNNLLIETEIFKNSSYVTIKKY